MSNELILREDNIRLVMSQAPQAWRDNQQSHDRCLASCQTLLDTIEAEGMNDALLYDDIQGFNTMLMWFGVIMVLLAVTLYITSCNKRRNYYISNVVSIGICAGGCFVLSLVAMIMNAGWRAEFLNIDFEAWLDYSTSRFELFGMEMHYSDSTLWFDLGFVVYILMMIASVMLVLNLVWKIKLMQGEKKLLNGSAQVGGVA